MKGKRTHAMLATILSATLAVGVIAGCGAQPQQTEKPAQDAAEEAEPAAEQEKADFDTTGGSPWLATVIRGNVTKDTPTSLTDDFYLAINKDWLATAEVPAGHMANTSFYVVEEEVAANAKAMLKDGNIKGHDAKLAKQLYDACLDWDTRNKQGVAPAQKIIDDINSLQTLDDIAAFICNPKRSTNVPMLVALGSLPMGSDATQNGTFIGFENALLGDPGDYREGVDKQSDGYKELLAVEKGLLTRLGYTEDETTKVVDEALALEEELTKTQFSMAEMADPKGLEGYHEVDYTPEEVKSIMKSFPLIEFAESRGYGATKMYNVGRDDQLPAIDALWREDNVQKIKSYFIAQYAYHVVDWLDEESYELYMKEMIDPRMRTDQVGEAYDTVRRVLPGPLSQAYVETYDLAPTKERITKLCEDAIQTYKELFKRQDWLSSQTREVFLDKLDHMKIRAVYPDKWKDYSGLDLDGLSYFECRCAIETYEQQLDAADAGKPVDEELWKSEDLLEDNGMYSAQSNSINIFLGILGGNFYTPDMSDEQMYAGIGSVIFHEISHAFDPRGVLFGSDGTLLSEPAWTEEDSAEYDRRAQKLTDYFNNIVFCTGKNANGDLYMGEAIADISGVEATLLAAKDIEDFDYDEYFRAYAALWRESGYPDAELELVDDDMHAPAYLRVNVTVQQFDEFLETYGVKEGDNMYLAPEDRILVWD